MRPATIELVRRVVLALAGLFLVYIVLVATVTVVGGLFR